MRTDCTFGKSKSAIILFDIVKDTRLSKPYHKKIIAFKRILKELKKIDLVIARGLAKKVLPYYLMDRNSNIPHEQFFNCVIITDYREFLRETSEIIKSKKK